MNWPGIPTRFSPPTPTGIPVPSPAVQPPGRSPLSFFLSAPAPSSVLPLFFFLLILYLPIFPLFFPFLSFPFLSPPFLLPFFFSSRRTPPPLSPPYVRAALFLLPPSLAPPRRSFCSADHFNFAVRRGLVALQYRPSNFSILGEKKERKGRIKFFFPPSNNINFQEILSFVPGESRALSVHGLFIIYVSIVY